MLQKAYITYTDNNALADAYQVVLGDTAQTFGLKRYDTGEVIEAFGTAVDHPSTGLYEYVFDAIPGVMYVVSWQVTPTSSSQPIYTEERVGPFYDPDQINVVSDFRGTFVQGTAATLAVQLMQLDGTPVDAEDIAISVQNSSTQQLIFLETPEKIKTGFYMYDWVIGGSQEPGPYDVYWTYKINGEVRVEIQQVIVAAHGTGTASQVDSFITYRMAVETYIQILQAIPIQHQVANQSVDNKTYRFAFKNWNQSATAVIYRNEQIITSGFEIDYMKGTVIFDLPNLREDVIHADYNFRFFSDDQLYQFLDNAVNDYNSCAPNTTYQIGSIPPQYSMAMVYGAVINAIRAWQQAVMWPMYRALYENRELADRIFEQMDSLKKDFAEDVKNMCDRKKLFPYVGLTRLIFQPIYQLPGGRARFFRYLFGTGNS